jgi:Tol biopolymer transport system component
MLNAARAAELLSVDSTGTRAGAGAVQETFCINADGRFAAFVSTATNLVAHDTNGIADIFVRDCVLRSNIWDTTRSLGSGGGLISSPISFTPDGRFLLFTSRATNLVAGATASLNQLYVQDLWSNVTTLVSVSFDGFHASGTAISSALPISDDGRFACFSTTATDLVAGVDSGTGTDVYGRDLVSGVTELITASPGGLALDRSTLSFRMSADGRFFAFSTQATNVVAGLANTNNTAQVYWRDRVAGTNALVSMDVTGLPCTFGSALLSLSRDGRYVCFNALATNVVSNQNDLNGTQDLFIRDMWAGETWLVTRATNGNTTGSRVTGGEFSANGEWMLVAPTVADLAPGVQDINSGSPDLYLHHLPVRSNVMVTLSLSGLTGASHYVSDGFAHVSSSGRYVLFSTESTNLATGAGSIVTRLLLRDQPAGHTLNPLNAVYSTLPYNAARFLISDDERFMFFLASANYDPTVLDQNASPDLFRAPLYEPRLHASPPGAPLTADGLSFTTWILQSSSDLVNWTGVATNTAGADGQVTLNDPMPPGARRFYRLIEP